MHETEDIGSSLFFVGTGDVAINGERIAHRVVGGGYVMVFDDSGEEMLAIVDGARSDLSLS